MKTVERFTLSKMTKTKYSVSWIDVTIKRLVKKASFTFLLVNPRALMSRFITSGSERMYRRDCEIHIGNAFQIYLHLRTTGQIPTLLA